MKPLRLLQEMLCPTDVSCMLCASEKGMGNGSGLCHTCLCALVAFEGQRDIGGFTMHASYVYRDSAASLIHGMKYENKRYMALPLIRGLVGTFCAKALHCDGIVPVPLHPRRKRQRGFNQSLLLAKGLSEGVRVPLWPGVLSRTRNTPQQVNLDEAERWKNVSGAFLCAGDVAG